MFTIRQQHEHARIKGRRLSTTQINTLRHIATGGRYVIHRDGKQADQLRWMNPDIRPLNAPSIPVLFKKGLIKMGRPWLLDIAYFNVVLTEKGEHAAWHMKTLTEIEIEDHNLSVHTPAENIQSIRCPRCSKEYRTTK